MGAVHWISGLERNHSPARRCAAAAVVRAGLAAAFLATLAAIATSFVATAQDQGAATARDAIFARKALMNSMCEKMAAIETMISQRRIDFDYARREADADLHGATLRSAGAFVAGLAWSWSPRGDGPARRPSAHARQVARV